jgi:Flp pilus assembly pilin Flp
MFTTFKNFITCERGAALAEYVLPVALIAVVAVTT